jgi:ubiquinone/menaquinone biosynthesis C-methylase UbiE
MNGNIDDQNRNTAYWGKIAKHYDGFIRQFAREYPALLKLMKSDLKPDDSVLEMACGTGIISLEISSFVRQVTATDISPEMIAIASTKAQELKINNVGFIIQDGYSLDFQDNSFDTCIISNALHVVPEPERMLKEAKRVLKPQGILITATYCHDENVKTKFISWLLTFTGFKAYRKFTSKSFIDLIEASGFSIIKSNVLKGNFPLIYIVARYL